MTEPFPLRSAAACGAAALLAVALYTVALHNPFVYHTVVGNRSIQVLGSLRAIVWHDVARPLTNFSYAIDYRIWGGGPFGFHLTNLLLHALNVALLFQLALALGVGTAPL